MLSLTEFNWLVQINHFLTRRDVLRVTHILPINGRTFDLCESLVGLALVIIDSEGHLLSVFSIGHVTLGSGEFRLGCLGAFVS